MIDPMAEPGNAELYDLRGLKCPLPVLKTQRRMRDMSLGQELLVATNDPMAVIDIPHFCNENGHLLVESHAVEDGHRFLIRKGEAPESD